MISYSHKFLFIQIPKTATSSIHGSLARYMKYDYSKIGRHSKYSEAAEFYPESKNYFKFSFVRNPWDRMLSFYLFKKTNRAHIKIPDDLSLKDFLLTSAGQIKFNQHSYIESFDTSSFIGRFENLQQDFDIICDKIGIPQRELQYANKSSHNHYTEYYDNETRRLVSEKFARDIDYFGYKFGE
jgi:chondroitin 4-sulfotransferase 11